MTRDQKKKRRNYKERWRRRDRKLNAMLEVIKSKNALDPIYEFDYPRVDQPC